MLRGPKGEKCLGDRTANAGKMARIAIGEERDEREATATATGRKQSEARSVAKQAYPFQCCVICGLQLLTTLNVAHLDHQPGNNDKDNLAWLCVTHHWMFDCDLYPIEAIKLMRTKWQETEGKPSHAGRMKQAGPKAAATRKRSASARKAWLTRRPKPEATTQEN